MTSNSIYTPTYLYIKQHSITGKLYFGKTIKNPEKYYGSGKYWTRHIKTHGKEFVETLWYCMFLDKESIQEFALNFSVYQNIVESDQWLNLIVEDGLNGTSSGNLNPNFGKVRTKIQRNNISNSLKGKPKTANHIANMKTPSGHQTNPRNKLSDSHKTKIQDSMKARLLISCPHCGKSGYIQNMMQWHFDRCKILKTL